MNKKNGRTMAEIIEHYEIEKELANRLRRSSREERTQLYSSLYDELFKRVPSHPQLTLKALPEKAKRGVARQLKFVIPFLRQETVFLEIGPGDCAFSFEVARHVRHVYAVDVSEEITKSHSLPPNFSLILTDSLTARLKPGSVDVVYSRHLMEHLHPDDAGEQLKNIHRLLVPGGKYVCLTPNRLNGPDDVSRYFDEVATGFHLKEYTTSELIHLFKQVGFSRVRVHVGGRGRYMVFPAGPVILFESLLARLPYKIRRAIGSALPFKLLLGIQLVVTK
jgi:SAM-dependent methyltransferase